MPGKKARLFGKPARVVALELRERIMLCTYKSVITDNMTKSKRSGIIMALPMMQTCQVVRVLGPDVIDKSNIVREIVTRFLMLLKKL